MPKKPDHPLSFEYNQITDEIFIGTNMCCTVHFDEELIKKGITADISVEAEKLDAPFGVEFFSWIPVKDYTSPTEDQLKLGVHVLDSLIDMKKKVYIQDNTVHQENLKISTMDSDNWRSIPHSSRHSPSYQQIWHSYSVWL